VKQFTLKGSLGLGVGALLKTEGGKAPRISAEVLKAATRLETSTSPREILIGND
jgi:hypothetical protein